MGSGLFPQRASKISSWSSQKRPDPINSEPLPDYFSERNEKTGPSTRQPAIFQLPLNQDKSV